MIKYSLLFIDKTIKLWKLAQGHDYLCQSVDEFNISQKLILPERMQPIVYTTQKRHFHSAHAYNINSISLNSDGESFVSCDDLRINCWMLDSEDTCFSKS
jgi:serine/threonine-protein phosphatase 2A regulatory subunit B